MSRPGASQTGALQDSAGPHGALQPAGIVERDAEQLAERIGQFAGGRQAALFRAAAQMVHREASVAECQPPVGQRTGKDQEVTDTGPGYVG